ncbi:uncharacterized protein LOC144042984 [Vanacampus margaritifer]
MLKELVRDRLLAAADEIFGLFEETIKSYEEQLCRAKDEIERQRREAQIVLRVEDVQVLRGHREKLSPQPQQLSFSLEEEHVPPALVKKEEPQLFYVKEEEAAADISNFPLIGFSAQSEDGEDEPGVGNVQLCPQPQQPSVGLEEERVPPALVEEEDPQLLHVKEEEAAADVGNFPPTGFSAQSEDEPPDLPQLRPHAPSGNPSEGPPSEGPPSEGPPSEGPPPDGVFAPLSGVDETSGEENSGTSQSGPKRFPCSVCGKIFSKRGWLIKHERRHKPERLATAHMRTRNRPRGSSCSPSDKTFIQSQDLVSDMKTLTRKKSFRCSFCPQRFRQESKRDLHVRTHARDDKYFPCWFCGRSFSKKSKMVNHAIRHMGANSLNCLTCGETFAHRPSLHAHVRTHTEKAHHCSLCGKGYRRKRGLRQHVQKMHKTGSV